MVKVRYATADDLDQFYGQERPTLSVRGVVADRDGEILGVIGLAYQDNEMQAFSSMKEDMRQYPMTIMRAVSKFKTILKSYGANVLAIANPDEKHSDKLLESVGFQFVEDIAEGRLYQWQTQ